MSRLQRCNGKRHRRLEISVVHALTLTNALFFLPTFLSKFLPFSAVASESTHGARRSVDTTAKRIGEAGRPSKQRPETVRDVAKRKIHTLARLALLV